MNEITMSDVRLIDANELKRDFAELCATECPICSFYIPSASIGDCHCGLIDRAQTAEITEEQAIDKLHETGWMLAHDKELTARSKGMWLVNGDCGDDIQCAVCGGVEKYPRYFCGWCGADMRGGRK